MATVHPFLQKSNVTMLWEVIVDEESFKFLPQIAQESVYKLFLANLQGFCDNERNKTHSLVDLNKKYILLLLSHIKKQYSLPSKIVIHDDPPPREAISAEDIQSERKTKTDIEFNRRRQEFDSYVNVKPPPTPSFADAQVDTPIKEIDKILKEMQAQRNYEVDTLAHTNTNADDWLKPQETSVHKPRDKIPDPQPSSSRFKFLNSLQEEESHGPLLQQEVPHRDVAFSKVTEVNTFVVEEEEEEDEHNALFAKLKKVPTKDEAKEDNTDNSSLRLDALERSMVSLHQKLDLILARLR